jgi:hypothetical protein
MLSAENAVASVVNLVMEPLGFGKSTLLKHGVRQNRNGSQRIGMVLAEHSSLNL